MEKEVIMSCTNLCQYSDHVLFQDHHGVIYKTNSNLISLVML